MGINLGAFQTATALFNASFDMFVTDFFTTSGNENCGIDYDPSLKSQIESNYFGSFYFPRVDVTFNIRNALLYEDGTPLLTNVFSDYANYNDPPGGWPYLQTSPPAFFSDFYVLFNGFGDGSIRLYDDETGSGRTRFTDLGIVVGDEVIYTN